MSPSSITSGTVIEIKLPTERGKRIFRLIVLALRLQLSAQRPGRGEDDLLNWSEVATIINAKCRIAGEAHKAVISDDTLRTIEKDHNRERSDVVLEAIGQLFIDPVTNQNLTLYQMKAILREDEEYFPGLPLLEQELAVMTKEGGTSRELRILATLIRTARECQGWSQFDMAQAIMERFKLPPGFVSASDIDEIENPTVGYEPPPSLMIFLSNLKIVLHPETNQPIDDLTRILTKEVEINIDLRR